MKNFKEWFNKKEEYIIKKERYNRRIYTAVFLLILSIVFILLASITNDELLSWLLSNLFSICFAVAVVILVGYSTVSLFYIRKVKQNGFIKYSLHIYRSKIGIRDPPAEDRLFDSFDDAEDYYENGPDWDKDEP